jgi:hypothetical protein
VITRSTGRLQAGSVLVSNFNNKANLQGTGSTIVQISPGGHRSLFAHITPGMLPGRCPGGVGLDTALVTLRAGWVIVASTPSKNGQAATSKAGCLIVLDSQGRVRETIAGHGINGPWDATVLDQGASASLFVTNVLNGTVAGGGAVVHRGTVLRLRLAVSAAMPPRLLSVTTIGSGFGEQTSSSAFVVGPTGVGLGRGGMLFVADTVANRITAIPAAATRQASAGTGQAVTSGGALSAPLGIAIAPGGDHPVPGPLRQPARSRGPVRPRRRPRRKRRLLCRRRRQHPPPPALTTRTAAVAEGARHPGPPQRRGGRVRHGWPDGTAAMGPASTAAAQVKGCGAMFLPCLACCPRARLCSWPGGTAAGRG